MAIEVKDFDDILAKDYNENACKEVSVFDVMGEIKEHFVDGYPLGETSHIKKLDENFRWRKGFLYAFSGYPQSGKSEIINWLMVIRAKMYGDKVLMYSPESNTKELILDLCRAYLGKNVNPEFPDICSEEEFDDALTFISEHFMFLENNNDMPTINVLIDKFEKFSDKGYSSFVIDPLNWVVESNAGESNLYQYLKLTLTILKQFAKATQSLMIYVEHPKTPAPVRGVIPRATAFSLAGGTMHFNKVDCMVVMHRLTDDDVQMKVKSGEILSRMLENKENHIKFVEFETVKMKSQRINGVLGSCIIEYDIKTGRYK
jgi:hypothetical protein|tara:strand:- start:929 stop:1876 length:948 start_codon:yes stop_codon:yes gene_type:complete